MISPTVKALFEFDPGWWETNGGGRAGRPLDRDGYDRDGWNEMGLDRAGNRESDYSDNRRVDAAMQVAERAGAALVSRLERRIPADIAVRVIDAVAEVLKERFPDLPYHDDLAEGVPNRGMDALIRTGENASSEPYVGAYFYPREHIAPLFSVIVESHPVTAAGFDPRSTWSATVMRADAKAQAETRFVGKATLDELLSEITKELGSFRPFQRKHAVYFVEPGDPAARFGAMAAEEFEAMPAGNSPGDFVAYVTAEDSAAALQEFAAMRPRTEGFMAMIERGIAEASEAASVPPAPGP